MNIKFSLLLLITTLTINCHSQVMTNSHYIKVVVEEDEEKIIGLDSVYIDTLVLKDGAKIKFFQHSVLVVENAFIGNKCEFNSSGTPGTDPKELGQLQGGDGEDGKNLTLIVNFKTLGSLTVNTSGGKGGNGSRGLTGLSGADGSNGEDGLSGGQGGDAGDAGNLTLLYTCTGFVPIFESKREHGIQLKHTGGEAGSGGRGGLGGKGGAPLTRVDYVNGTKRVVVESPRGKNGLSGKNGSHGRGGKDGELIVKRRD
jgi:hypothetical protein